jgi:hypothetical protein
MAASLTSEPAATSASRISCGARRCEDGDPRDGQPDCRGHTVGRTVGERSP